MNDQRVLALIPSPLSRLVSPTTGAGPFLEGPRY